MSALPNVGVRRKWLRLIFPAGELGQVTPRSSLLRRVFCSIRLNHSTKGHRPELPQVCLQTKGEGMTYSIWMYGCEKKGCVTATTTLTEIIKDIVWQKEYTEAQLVSCLQACR